MRLQRPFGIAIFLSGFAGLLLQTLWVRRLGFIFGNTTVSVSLVLGSFFFGMALGGRLLGRRADRSSSPQRLYAGLELGIALTAALVWFALIALEPVYVWLYRASDSNVAAIYVAQLALTFVLLSVPAFLMGGTLPSIVRCAAGDDATIARSVGGVYALNALGAAIGLLAGSFVLIELFGLVGAYSIAISCNLAAALLAFLPRRESTPASPLEDDPSPVSRWLLILAFVTGFTGMSYEVLWIRLWSFVSLHSDDNPIGRAPASMSSTYVFSFIVFLVVAGIALGGSLVKVIRRAGRAHLEDLAIVQALLGVWGLLGILIEPFLAFDTLTAKLFEVTVIVLPMATLMGIGFPLLAAEAIRNVRGAGERFGKFYAWNTLGSCAGPIATGLILLPARGTYAVLTLLCITNFVVSVVLVATTRPQPSRRRLLAAAATLGLVEVLGFVALPFPSMAKLTSRDASRILYEEDNAVAHTLVLDYGSSRVLVVNNHMVSAADPAHGFGRLTIQVPAALLGRVPKDILVLCVGTGGSLAGTLRYDAHAAAVDINPAVFRTLPMLHSAEQYRRLTGPNVRQVIGDARNFLLLDDRQYDIINIDPAPPITQPGMVNLHTVEFYRLARARLKPGGVLIQRLSGGGDSESFYPELLASISTVFPEVTVWSFLGRGLDVIASGKRLDHLSTDPALIDPDIVAQATKSFLFDRKGVDSYVGSAAPITDDRPALEFNLLSRLREDRFGTRRAANLRRIATVHQEWSSR